MMKKVFAVLLAMTMAGSLAACGGSTTASSSSEPAAEETAEATAEEETDAAEATADAAADTAASSDLKYAVILKTTATVAQDSAGIGVKCLEMLVDAVANPDKYPASAAPEKTPIDGVLVTSENAADYVK